MPLTAAQIVTLSCQIAKCPGFTSQGGQFLNATLQDLCQDYDLDQALGTNSFNFNSAVGQGAGPYSLPADYLRTQVIDGKDEFFYTIQGVPYPLIQITKAEYDWLVQTPGYQSFPYNYATDLSQSPAQLFVWPPANGAYPCIQRYYRLMPDIVTPESSATVPWFLNTDILITSTAGRLMGVTGDERYTAYMSEDLERYPTSWKAKLNAYLKNVKDREGAVKTVGKDRRRWGRPFDQLKNTKNIGWAIAAFFACCMSFLQPEPAQANCTTPCTKSQITTDINTNWPDNTTNLITPALLRSTVLDLVNSYLDTNGTASFTCPTHQFLTSIATLSSYTCTQPTTADVSGARIKLTVPTTFNVDVLGTDAPTCGITTGAGACRTRGYLINTVLAPNYDFGLQTVTVQLAHGTYTDSLQELAPMLIGQNGPGGLIFTGDCTAGNTSAVLIQPSGGVGYTYGFAFGFSARIQCQKLDQTTQVRAGNSNDLVVAGQGSSILIGNSSLFNVRADMTFGCNVNPFNTFTIGPRGGYLEFDNDFTIDVGSCQVQITGTPTNGSAVIGSIASTTNIVKYMGIIGTNIPTDAFVNSIVTNTSVTMACLYTSPCQANGSPGAETITFTGGGQTFIDGDGSNVFFNTNGDPSFSIIGTLANFPFYTAGWMFINDVSIANAQAITWVNPGQGRGHCSVDQNLSVTNTNFQGLPYFPCNALAPEVSASPSGAVTAGSKTFGVTSATGIVVGQVVTDVVGPTATWTAGSATMVVSSATGIAVGAKVSGPGILAGAFVSNIAGTTITVSGCGSGPRCVSGSPLYISETAISVFFSNSLFSGGSVVTGISGTTITISDTIKGSGTPGNIWFQGRVFDSSLYK